MQTFEDRLLAELKDVVAARAEAGETPAPARHAPARRRTIRRRAALGAGLAAAAAAAAIAVPVLNGEDGPQANAVERRPDGGLVIKIREFTHPDRIEAKLRAYGVPSVVSFIPSGKQCKGPRGDFIDDRIHDVFGRPDQVIEEPSSYLIYPKRLQPGETAVIDVWALLGKNGEVKTSIMKPKLYKGKVAPCVLVGRGPEVHEDWAGDGPGAVEEPVSPDEPRPENTP